MARVNRNEVLSDLEIQAVHCVNRCVRRGFLCGVDPMTGKSYEHRRQWIRNRMEFLAGVFGVEVLGFAVMSNHFHAVLRNRPDVVATWSDEEVLRRWWLLFPRRRGREGGPAELTDAEVKAMLTDPSRIRELRQRLSSISWFMRCMSEVIARRANGEDECTGRFWEGRFHATVLPDEAAIAACLAYVDLNPIRAGQANTPEESRFTSAHERIRDLKAARAEEKRDARRGGAADKSNRAVSTEERIENGRNAGWLAPVELEPGRRPHRRAKNARRASNKGCLFMTLEDYLQLLDWTGRQVHPEKTGSIPKDTPAILERLELSRETWLQTVAGFARRTTTIHVSPASEHDTSEKSLAMLAARA